MCGIAGILAYDGPIPKKLEIETMTQALVHRGPDGAGVFVEKEIALGHRRLSIIDLESGSQPMESTSGMTVISYNGEIYNYLELRKDLEKYGYPFKTKSDTEVILALYEKHGNHFLNYLRGMFAFALWDRKNQKLILARDRIGIKPLYYAKIAGRLYFASEIKAIRKLEPHLNSLNIESVNSYFTRQYIGGNNTIIEGIKKLEAGYFLEIAQKRMRTEVYWRPEPKAQNHLNIENAVEHLDDFLHKTVKSHLVSDVPVGVFLSGGVDSSLLLTYAARNSSTLQTFSVGFGENSNLNETQYARTMAERFKTQHHEIHISNSDVLEALPLVIKNLDEPLADYAILPTYIMSKFAAEKVKVVLSGEGADELFGGYKRYHLYALLDLLPKFKTNGFLDAILPGACLFKDKQRTRLLAECYLDSHSLNAERQMLADKRFFAPAGHLNSMLFTDLKNWLVDDLLMKVDKMGMLASLEARVPYLDHQLVEFVLSLSGNQKVGIIAKKRLLKRVAKLELPPEIWNRPKHGFTAPVSHWIKGPLSEPFHDIVFSDSVNGLLDKDYIEKLVKQHSKGKDVGFKLWAIFVFCWWVQINL